jgi:hypothetical protein
MDFHRRAFCSATIATLTAACGLLTGGWCRTAKNRRGRSSPLNRRSVSRSCLDCMHIGRSRKGFGCRLAGLAPTADRGKELRSKPRSTQARAATPISAPSHGNHRRRVYRGVSMLAPVTGASRCDEENRYRPGNPRVSEVLLSKLPPPRLADAERGSFRIHAPARGGIEETAARAAKAGVRAGQPRI